MALRSRSSVSPAPFSFAPSQAFEGNDGSWSTFVIRVGTPEQVFHVLISTAGQETWVPVPQGCLLTDPNNCGELRGAMPFQSQPSSGFNVNASSTWTPIGLYALGLGYNLNYTGNGIYGYDNVGLQLPGSGGISLKHHLVAGIATKDFYLGVFGLGPKPTNFTDFENPQPSFMWTLRNQSLIPSQSFGYTAGASYRLKQVTASLTLGGYDESKFVPNDIKFAFSMDDSKSLTVGLKSIEANDTFQGQVSLLQSGILSLIDSTVPEIWLPVEACKLFETAFGLTFDPTTDRYLVNSSIHDDLKDRNPVLTFRLGNTIDSIETVNISLPYASFDLQANYPIYSNSTNYFPLRRAVSSTQYTLGRTFLQEAYIVADYERLSFSVSQCTFDEARPSRIIPIQPPSNADQKKTGLSKGALVGIIVAAIVLAMILATIVFIILKVRKARKDQKRFSEASTAYSYGQDLPEVVQEEPLKPVEVSAAQDQMIMEMMGGDMRPELGDGERRAELPG